MFSLQSLNFDFIYNKRNYTHKKYSAKCAEKVNAYVKKAGRSLGHKVLMKFIRAGIKQRDYSAKKPCFFLKKGSQVNFKEKTERGKLKKMSRLSDYKSDRVFYALVCVR